MAAEVPNRYIFLWHDAFLGDSGPLRKTPPPMRKTGGYPFGKPHPSPLRKTAPEESQDY